MENITLRLRDTKINNQEEHIIQRNYYTLKNLFPVNNEYVFVSDLANTSVIDQMVQRYFNKKTGNETVLCSTVQQLQNRLIANDFPEQLMYVFVVDGVFDEKEKLRLKFPEVAIYEGWADFEGFPIISLNTNNWEGRGLDGKPIIQEGKKEQSVGRILAGVAVKLVDQGNEVTKANQSGCVFVKYLPDMEWVNTYKTGYIDECGFLYLDH